MQKTAQLLDSINTDLKNQADPAYRTLVHTRYNMNIDHFWGVRTPTIRKIANKYYKEIQSQTIGDQINACQDLLVTRIYEHKIIAFHWANLARKEYKPEHLSLFTAWLNEYVDDWIDCDDLCIHVVGEFFLLYPDTAKEVVQWTKSPNLWVRRGAAVSLVLPNRKGQRLTLAFKVADSLLEDQEDLVQKGYGWLLKVASKHYPEEVYHYLMNKREKMPRASLRYAVEKLPEQMRQDVMAK